VSAVNLSVLPLAVLLFAGCGADPDPSDAGDLRDAGSAVDAGDLSDASDAGDLSDASDVGEARDAGDGGTVLRDASGVGWRLGTSEAFRGRANRVATLLPSGSIFVAGGDGIEDVDSSAEEYEPAANRWGARVMVRSGATGNHTQTLLESGEVLFTTGGLSDLDGAPTSSASAACSLYDSAARTVTPTGSLTDVRSHHTATQLPDGRVLVVAGAGRGRVGSDWTVHPLASAELYDRATGLWASAMPLATPRWSHTAALLDSGLVLVTGGTGDGVAPLASAALYDPATNTWRAAGAMRQARWFHRAVKLRDGRVLIVGGTSGAAALAHAELNDPASNTFVETAAMPGAAADSAVVALDADRVLVSGGYDTDPNASVTAVYLYDDRTEAWTIWAPMNVARRGHSAVLLADGRVVVLLGKVMGAIYDRGAEITEGAP